MTSVEKILQAIESGDEKAYEIQEVNKITVDDFINDIKNVAKISSIMLQKIDFTIPDASTDKPTQFMHYLLLKALTAFSNMKQEKALLLPILIDILNTCKDKPIDKQHTPACIIIADTFLVLQREFFSQKKNWAQLAPILGAIIQQKKIDNRLITSLIYPLTLLNTTAPDELAKIGGAVIDFTFSQEAWQFLMQMPNLCEKFPDRITPYIPTLIELLENENPQAKHSLPMVFKSIATKNPQLLIEHVPLLVGQLESQMAAIYCQALEPIVKYNPQVLGPHLDKLKQLFLGEQIALLYSLKSIFTCCYKDSKNPQEIKEIYEVYFARIDKDQDIYKPTTIMGINELARSSDLHRTILKENYRQKVDGLLSVAATKQMVEGLIDYLENRSLQTLNQRVDVHEEKIVTIDKRIDVQDAKVATMEVTVNTVKQDVIQVKTDVKKLDDKVAALEKLVEEQKKWVAENLDSLRNSMAKMGKVLPVPIDMTIKYQGIDTVSLHFVCAYHKDENCLYPGPDAESGKTFTTDTKQVNRWIKIGVQAVSIGVKIFHGDFFSGISNLKNIWDIYNDKPEDKFDTFSKEPFLTSTEQDDLVNQLRQSHYYKSFAFDPAHEGWSCYKCLGKEIEEEKQTKMQAAVDYVEDKQEMGQLVKEQVDGFTSDTGCCIML